MIIWSIVFIFIAIFIYLAHAKIEFLKTRSRSKKISAVVIEYRKEKASMRNDFTLLNYPYVKIDMENNNSTIRKLRYADNGKKPFKIGEKIDIFWYGKDLLYWNAYDSGLNKYLPEKWNFIN